MPRRSPQQVTQVWLDREWTGKLDRVCALLGMRWNRSVPRTEAVRTAIGELRERLEEDHAAGGQQGE